MIGLRSHRIVDINDHPQPSSDVHPSEEKVTGSLDITDQEPKQGNLPPPEGPPNPVGQDCLSNGFGFISPIIVDQNVVHSKESEPQVQDISIPSYFDVSPCPAFSSAIDCHNWIHVFVFSVYKFLVH